MAVMASVLLQPRLLPERARCHSRRTARLPLRAPKAGLTTAKQLGQTVCTSAPPSQAPSFRVSLNAVWLRLADTDMSQRVARDRGRETE